MYHCPCCGQPVDKVDPREVLKYIHLSPVQERIVTILLRNFGRPVDRDRISDFVYANTPNGGPENAGNIVSATISRLRSDAILEKVGLTIARGTRLQGARLHWIEE